MDNAELSAELDRLTKAVEEIAAALRPQHREGAGGEREPPVVASVGYPWAPATVSQGFLSGRWQRRDGDIYPYVAPSD